MHEHKRNCGTIKFFSVGNFRHIRKKTPLKILPQLAGTSHRSAIPFMLITVRVEGKTNSDRHIWDTNGEVLVICFYNFEIIFFLQERTKCIIAILFYFKRESFNKGLLFADSNEFFISNEKASI